MQIKLKISIFLTCLLQAVVSLGQNETYIQPFTNRIEINPGFAGLNQESGFHTGNQYYQVNKKQMYNLFYATWDRYSDKLKGGIAYSFKQGIISERNTTVTKFGFAYSGFKNSTKNGDIYFSLGVDIGIATKQWTIAFLDKLLIDEHEQSSQPGRLFARYAILKPKAGFLWTDGSFFCGLTAALPYRHEIADDAIDPVEFTSPVSLSVYLSKKIEKHHHGLHSRPFRLSPELILFYNQEYFMSRLRLISGDSEYNWGVFIQNDFTNNAHIAGGNLGYNYNAISISLYGGMGIPGISDDNPFMAELTFRITVPPFYHSRISPWSYKNNTSVRKNKYKKLRDKQKKHENNFDYIKEKQKKVGENKSLLYILKNKYKR